MLSVAVPVSSHHAHTVGAHSQGGRHCRQRGSTMRLARSLALYKPTSPACIPALPSASLRAHAPRAQGKRAPSELPSERAAAAGAAVAGLAAPALLLQAVQRAAAALHPRPPKRVKRSISQSGRACGVTGRSVLSRLPHGAVPAVAAPAWGGQGVSSAQLRVRMATVREIGPAGCPCGRAAAVRVEVPGALQHSWQSCKRPGVCGGGPVLLRRGHTGGLVCLCARHRLAGARSCMGSRVGAWLPDAGTSHALMPGLDACGRGA